MRRLGAIILLASFLGTGASARAAETASFLKISPGARPVAMGEAFTAVADDLNALAWNPAGLARLKRPEAAFMHAELFVDTSYDFLGYAHPMRASLGTVSFGVARLGHGTIEGRDENGGKTGGFDASDTALMASYSRGLGALRLGGTFKFLESAIGGERARSFAMDLGLQRAVHLGGRPVQLGAALLNLGPGMRFVSERSDLPLVLSFGAASKVSAGFLISADYRYRPHASQGEFAIGAEISVLPALILRSGYTARMASVAGGGGGLAGGDLAGLGMGMGLRVGRTRLDYSFAPAGELGAAQRLSVSARF